MRRSFTASRLRHLVPLVLVALAAGLPGAAQARGGGAGGGMGGFHGGGSFHGGGFSRGGVVVAPRAVVAAPRAVVGFSFGSRAVTPFRHGGVRPFHGHVVGRPRHVVLVPRPFVPFGPLVLPFTGVIVPPLTGNVVAPSTGAVVLRPVTRASVRVAPEPAGLEIWRMTGDAWQRDPAMPPAAVWRRDGNGRWHAGSVE